jgi:hypothetical protein
MTEVPQVYFKALYGFAACYECTAAAAAAGAAAAFFMLGPVMPQGCELG